MDDNLRSMLEEQRKLIEETNTLARENHQRIKKMYRNMQQSFYARIVYWVVIILITAGAFYAIAPTIAKLLEQYQAVTRQVNQVNDYFGNPEQFLEKAFVPSEVNFFSDLFNLNTQTGEGREQ